MLNIFNTVDLTLDERGRIQAKGFKNLSQDQADEARQLIKSNRDAIVEYLKLCNKACTLADFVQKQTKTPESQPCRAKEQDIRTCRACGGTSYWCKNEPGSKPICLKCHPPAKGMESQNIVVLSQHDEFIEKIEQRESMREHQNIGSHLEGNEGSNALLCPAKDQNTGLCYGPTYFEGKPGSKNKQPCVYSECPYKAKVEEAIYNKKIKKHLPGSRIQRAGKRDIS